MKYKNVYFESFAHVLPPHVVTSEEVEAKLAPVYQRLKVPEGRLEMMSGVKSRRFWDEGSLPSQGAIQAGEKAIEQSGIPREKIGALIFSSISKDCMEPATATVIHDGLKLSRHSHIFDLSNACLGFANSMLVLANMIELGQVEAGIVLAAECAEELYRGTFNTLLNDSSITRRILNQHFASLTTGSGAAALIMTHQSLARAKHQLLGGVVRNATEHNRLCVGGVNDAVKGIAMETDSEVLLHRGCELAEETWHLLQEEIGWQDQVPTQIFTHQVGQAHQKLMFQKTGLPIDRDFPTIQSLGNIGSVSLPISAALGTETHPPEKNSTLAFLGIGSGLNCCMLGASW